MAVSEYSSLLEKLKDKNIVVYGTGFVAKGVLLALERCGLDKNICAFTSTNVDTDEVYGYPYLSIEMCKKRLNSPFFILAVHEIHMLSIVDNLESLGETDYIWIYPFLYDLLLGEVNEKDKMVAVADIVRNVKDCRLVIRKLAIEYVLGKNTFGRDIYVKYQMLHTNQKSAEQRFERFKGLVELYMKLGTFEENIKLDQDMDILDGAHRMAIANYFNQEFVCCDIYGDASVYKQWIGDGAHATLDVVKASGAFSKSELDIICQGLD